MTVVNQQKKYIYVHIPKTAGTSIESIVGGLGHKTIGHVLNRDNEKYFKFAFVRNPYDRFVSACMNHHKITTSDGLFKFATNNSSFIKAMGYTQTDAALQHFYPQHKYVTLGGVNVMDFIGKFESLHEDWEEVSDTIGVSEKLPHLRKGITDCTLLSEQVKRVIYNIYKEDFEMFGYAR